MKLEFDGRTWDLSEKDITNKQADAIRQHTGLSMQKWLASLFDKDAHAWESSFDALFWLMLQQNPETAREAGLVHPCAIADLEYPVYRFMEAYGDAFMAERAAEKEAEPDPTRPPAASAPSPASPTRKASSRGGGTPDG